jgi:hypothetical protein
MMYDPRLQKFARVVVAHSRAVKLGELERIRGASVCEPLTVAISCYARSVPIDQKISGTFHDAGNGRLVSENGRFLNPRWQQPE